MLSIDFSAYPDLARVSRDFGIPENNLLEAFAIESQFHQLILEENEPRRRQEMYREMYSRVHPLYGKTAIPDISGRSFLRIVRLFERELKGRSVLDVGCGTGDFLRCVANTLPHGRLHGIDASPSVLPVGDKTIEFTEANVVDFELDCEFDVIFSHHVLEHIASPDVHSHLRSVTRALTDGGCFIVCMPNRLFGPSDVTRILDYSYTNRLPAQGSHLNELTYTETIDLLRSHGFTDFRTTLPGPKIRYYFPNIRLDPSFLVRIEKSPQIIDMLHHIRIASQCVARFDIFLICQ